MKHWNLAIIGYWVIGTGCQIKKDLELNPSPQNRLNDSWKILSLLISIEWPSLVTQWVVIQKINSTMYPVWCTNTHHDATGLVNHEII